MISTSLIKSRYIINAFVLYIPSYVCMEWYEFQSFQIIIYLHTHYSEENDHIALISKGSARCLTNIYHKRESFDCIGMHAVGSYNYDIYSRRGCFKCCRHVHILLGAYAIPSAGSNFKAYMYKIRYFVTTLSPPPPLQENIPALSSKEITERVTECTYMYGHVVFLVVSSVSYQQSMMII